MWLKILFLLSTFFVLTTSFRHRISNGYGSDEISQVFKEFMKNYKNITSNGYPKNDQQQLSNIHHRNKRWSEWFNRPESQWGHYNPPAWSTHERASQSSWSSSFDERNAKAEKDFEEKADTIWGLSIGIFVVVLVVPIVVCILIGVGVGVGIYCSMKKKRQGAGGAVIQQAPPPPPPPPPPPQQQPGGFTANVQMQV